MALRSNPHLTHCSTQQRTVPHFQERDRQNPVTAEGGLPDEYYSHALDHLVISCVDLVFTHQNRLLLAKRNRYPRPSWWVIGGRMMAGEHPLATAQRKAAQEANLTILDAARFDYIGTYSTCFAIRHQQPHHHGLHSLNLTYGVELTVLETQQLSLYPGEYESWNWFDFNEVDGVLHSSDVMDNALLTVIQDLKRHWQH